VGPLTRIQNEAVRHRAAAEEKSIHETDRQTTLYVIVICACPCSYIRKAAHISRAAGICPCVV
jgi:hypothetical protein